MKDKHKPHVRHGRFFNHVHDTISGRLREFFTTLGTLAVKNTRMREKHDKSQANITWQTERTFPERSDDLKITWLGHATFLIQVAGINILTDPVFYEISRTTPRYIDPILAPKDLPPIDVVLISHNHPDHVDSKSLRGLLRHHPHVLLPLGDRTWFKHRGFRHAREFSWWEMHDVNGVQFTFLPANHWSGRHLIDMNRSLWGSWMIEAGDKRIYFAGDTAYSDHFTAIAQAYQKIDVVLMPIGPNGPDTMRETHVSAQEAVQGFIELDGTHFIPMHWGTFKFGTDLFMLPHELLHSAWQEAGAQVSSKQLRVLKHGETCSF